MTTNVLLYERPFSAKLFRDVIQKVHGDADVTGVSSYRGSSDIWSGEYLYDAMLDYDSGISEEEIRDIIVRDRSLTAMPYERARRIVTRFWNGAQKLFEQGKFDYLYTINIDCYEIDILLRLADRFRVIPISFVGCFIPGYTFLTLRGERRKLDRPVSDCEAEAVTKKLLDKYYLPPSEQHNVKKQEADVRKYFYRRLLIERLYNPLQRAIQRDPDNLIFNVPLIGHSRLTDYMTDSYDKYFVPLDELNIDRGTTVYHPLHVIPEASTSYFCQDVAKLGYEKYVCSIIENADPGINFLIKEHPGMYGRRKLAFYDKLNSYPNVQLISPFASSNELLEMVDTVVVDNGTVGFESLLRGKRVLALEDNYYDDLHPNVFRISSLKKGDLSKPLQAYDSVTTVKSLLTDLFPSDYSNNKQQETCSADQIADGVRMYLSQLEA